METQICEEISNQNITNSQNQSKFEDKNDLPQVNIEGKEEQKLENENIENAKICIKALEKLKQEEERALKKSRKRIFVIKELVNTEDIFVKKMHIIEDRLKKGLQKLLSEDDINKIFSNSETILQFNKNFLGYLQDKTKNLEQNATVFDEQLLQFIHYFQIYSDYLQNYEVSNNFLNSLIKKQKNIQEYCEIFEEEYEHIQSLLIAPLQRLTKYPLLFKELLDATSDDNLDEKKIIEKCKKKFEQVCSKVNESIQKHLDNQKICELSQAFKNFNLNLIEHKKEYKFEESLTLIEGEKNCIVNFFADLILVSEKNDVGSTVPLRFLSLNQSSSVKQLDDMKYFHNIFKVSGIENDLTFMAQNEQEKNKIVNKLIELINNLGQKNKQDMKNHVNIEVNVLGTEERSQAKISKYTVYVTEVKINNIALKIWVRYSQLSTLEKIIKQNIKDVEIDHLSTKMSWLISQSTILIEKRKVLVESFLKQILTIKKIKESEIMQYILKEIGLPKDFYELPFNSHTEINAQSQNLDDYQSEDDDQEQSYIQENSESDISIQGKRNEILVDQDETFNEKVSEIETSLVRKKKKSQSLIAIGTLSTSETLNKKYQSLKERRQTLESSDSFGLNERCIIEVELPDGSKQEIEINSQTPCSSICAQIAKKIHLQSYYDYRIFLKDSEGLKVQDEDYPLFKTLFPDQKSLQNNAVLVSNGKRRSQPEVNITNNLQLQSSTNGSNNSDTINQNNQFDSSPSPLNDSSSFNNNAPFWRYSSENDKEQRFFTKLLKKIGYSERYTIVFQKYLWLSCQQEEYDIRQDPVRLSLVCYQISKDIQQQKYELSFKDYVLVSSLYISMIYGEKTDMLFQTSQDKDQKLSKSFLFDKIKEIIPDIIFNQKEENFWVNQIKNQLQSINLELSSILKDNQEKINNKHSSINILKSQDIPSSSEQNNINIPSSNTPKQKNFNGLSKYTCLKILTSKICLAQIALFNAIKNNKFFGVTLYYVNTYKKTLSDFNNLKDNVWLGVKHSMVYILCPEQKKDLFKIEYERLESTKKYNNKIQLITKNPQQDFQFVTNQFYEIKQLIDEYQSINIVLASSSKVQKYISTQSS